MLEKKLSRKILILHRLKILNLSRREALFQTGILAWAWCRNNCIGLCVTDDVNQNIQRIVSCPNLYEPQILILLRIFSWKSICVRQLKKAIQIKTVILQKYQSRIYKLTVIPNWNEIQKTGLGQVKHSAVFCLLLGFLELLNKVNSNQIVSFCNWQNSHPGFISYLQSVF